MNRLASILSNCALDATERPPEAGAGVHQPAPRFIILQDFYSAGDVVLIKVEQETRLRNHPKKGLIG
jgi:hypothetical protein